ncbi:SGNH/GDSL hydrolase family protein [Alicyclobacillus suci]|uniref:SGNH/GDSL hydrolase family protein n=1 Tax=Alicyclobacillus suci TaxID=2816080 RepID=UPI001A9052DC|nr:SGNH/GDSL hydrolase family protein [Alicyclobacillus suci]
MKPEKVQNKVQRYKKIRNTVTYVICAAALVLGGWALAKVQSSNKALLETTPPNSLQDKLTTEKVMIIGGSMAHGWKDPNDNSYLKRAFASLSDSTNTNWVYDDRTTVGGSPVSLQKKATLQTWLDKDKPQVVVISWGLLNDVYDKTPMNKFNAAFKDEIKKSLAAHAVVLIVTSPVTKATALYDHDQVEQYIQNEVKDASAFHSKNIYFIDLNSTMSTYMKAHNQTWQMYYGDSWHPNQAGHELGGKLLYNELIQTFGTGPILYKRNTAKSAQS